MGKKFYNSLNIGPNFFLQLFKTKIIFNFVKFAAREKVMTTNFFSPLSFVAVFGTGIRDPGSGLGKIQDPGSGINIPDPPQWDLETFLHHYMYVPGWSRIRCTVVPSYPLFLTSWLT